MLGPDLGNVEALNSVVSLGKRVEIRTYPNASHAFMNKTRPAGYDQAAATEAWDQSMSFLKNCFLGTLNRPDQTVHSIDSCFGRPRWVSLMLLLRLNA